MRIAIITIDPRTNMGGIIQAYALQTALRRMGHDTELLGTSYDPCPLWRRPLRLSKRLVLRYMLRRKDVDLFVERSRRALYAITTHNTQPFIDKHIQRRVVDNLYSLHKNDYDAFVVGSDQVWRPEYFGRRDISNAYLDFARHWHVRRIAYAASFGKEEWMYTAKQTLRCAALAKLFDIITVREESAVALCRNYLGVEAYHVLDPTMLLDADDYMRLVRDGDFALPISPGNLFTYILNRTPEKRNIIDTIAQRQGLIPFDCIEEDRDLHATTEQQIQKPVEAWLRAFHDADYVVTDSFHGTVFSIIFNKPFTVIANPHRGLTRLSSLLQTYGLENRLMNPSESVTTLPPIDWKHVNSVRDLLRQHSLTLLAQALK